MARSSGGHNWWEVPDPGKLYHSTQVPWKSWWGINVLLRAEEPLGCVISEHPCFVFAAVGWRMEGGNAKWKAPAAASPAACPGRSHCSGQPQGPLHRSPTGLPEALDTVPNGGSQKRATCTEFYSCMLKPRHVAGKAVGELARLSVICLEDCRASTLSQHCLLNQDGCSFLLRSV